MGGGFTAAPSVVEESTMAKKDPLEGADLHLFVIPCVELEDSTFRSVAAAIQGCEQSGCANKKHCARPALLHYALVGSVKRKG